MPEGEEQDEVAREETELQDSQGETPGSGEGGAPAAEQQPEEGSQPDQEREPEEGARSRESADAAGPDVPQEEPTESEEAPEAPEEAGLLPAELVPPERGGVQLPFVGEVSFRMLVTVLGLVVVALIGGLVTALTLRPAAAPVPVVQEGAVAGEPGRLLGTEETALLQAMSQLGYEKLVEKGDEWVAEGDYARAVRFYREATRREQAGESNILLARYKLARALAPVGDHEEALRLCEALRSVSRPGDQLWKHTLIAFISILGERERWGELFRQVCLLRANSARYSDEAAVNGWLAYLRAMAWLRIFLARSGQAARLYGMEVPAFGRAPSRCRPLMAEHIAIAPGKYGDGTLRADFATGELRLVAEGAPLGRVLSAVADATGIRVRCDETAHYRVTASLVVAVPEHAVEILLGSVGLEARKEGQELVARPLDLQLWSDDDTLKMTRWGLQEFLMLYPESADVPEAYYALAHIYMTQGHTETALRQLEILSAEFPRSIWNVYGHYVAGRACAELEDWERAERELLSVVDSPLDHPLKQPGFLWTARSQVALQKYDDAAACFRRALGSRADDPLAPEILYNIAFCMEKASAPLLQVEERYTEVRTRYPETEYAHLADYRLARMAMEAGDYGKAAYRYEFYLTNWPIEGVSGREACRDLITCYMRNGEYTRAVLLAEVMWSTFGHVREYWQALPSLLKACRNADLQDIGVEFVDRSLEAVQAPTRRWELVIHKARFLVDLGRYEEADTLLAQLEGGVSEEALLHRARLQRARILMASAKALQAVELCRHIVVRCADQEVRAEALKLIGRFYEDQERFDIAAMVYAGKYPVGMEAATQ